MDQWIVAMLNAISTSTADTGNLLKLPSDYNATMYNAMTTFQNVAVKPITALVLSVMLMLMLQQATTRADGDKMLSVRLVASVMIKACLVLAVLRISGALLQGIDQIGVSLAKSGSNIDVGTGSVKGQALGDAMKSSIDSANWGAQAAMLMIVLFPWLIANVVGILPTVMIFWRFIQLDLMTAFSSLPLAFLAHEDTKQIGIGYLKRYATITLQGVMLIAGIKLYQALISGWVTSTVHTSSDPMDFLMKNFGNLFVAPLILALVVIGSSSLSKAVIGEG
jgi:hypothetical protein